MLSRTRAAARGSGCCAADNGVQEGLGGSVGSSRHGANGTPPRGEGHAKDLPGRRGAPRRQWRDLPAHRVQGEAVLRGACCHQEPHAARSPAECTGQGREHGAPPRGGRGRAGRCGGPAAEGRGADRRPEQRRRHGVRPRRGVDQLLHDGESGGDAGRLRGAAPAQRGRTSWRR